MTAPGLRQLREAVLRRSVDGRAAAVALVDSLLCDRCCGSIPGGSCTCRAWTPTPQAETVAAAAALTEERAA